MSSCFTHVWCGVPQGSTLRPLLFLLYVNDISRVLPGENVELFADDTNLFISGVDVNTLIQKCNYCIETLNQWFIANRLHVNVDKTNIMIFPKNEGAKLSDITITKVQYWEYLGIFLDDTLTWSHHIDTVYSKFMKHIGTFYSVLPFEKFCLSRCVCLSVCLSFCLSLVILLCNCIC